MSTPEWRRRPDVLWRRTTDSAVVLPAGVDEPLVLSGAAALFWDVLEVPTPFDETVDLLASACQVPPEDVRIDIVALVEALADAGVIEETGHEC